MAGTTRWNKEAVVSLHRPAFSVLGLIAMCRLSSVATFTAWEIQHAGELVGRI